MNGTIYLLTVENEKGELLLAHAFSNEKQAILAFKTDKAFAGNPDYAYTITPIPWNRKTGDPVGLIV